MYHRNAVEAIPEQTKKPLHLERMWRSRLRELCKLRYGDPPFLPDDAEGHAMLMALLVFGETDDGATAYGFWCEAELPTLRRQAQRMDWRRDVGKLIGLTFEEWGYFKLFVLRPVDKSEAEIEKWRKKQRKASSDRSKAKAKAREKAEKEQIMQAAISRKLTPRQNAILEILIAHGEMMLVRDLIREASKRHAFVRSRSQKTTWCNGPPSSALPRNFRYVVHRTLDQLVEIGAIQSCQTPGDYGPVRWVEVASKLAVTPSHGLKNRNQNKNKSLHDFAQKSHAREFQRVTIVESDSKP